jgi:hypothetical protein
MKQKPIPTNSHATATAIPPIPMPMQSNTNINSNINSRTTAQHSHSNTDCSIKSNINSTDSIPNAITLGNIKYHYHAQTALMIRSFVSHLDDPNDQGKTLCLAIIVNVLFVCPRSVSANEFAFRH